MNVYDALAEPVRSWIDARGWNDFTEIQAAAIPHILAGRGALLVSSTASGKTEAAMLPMVSTILADRLPSVALLYVSPLKALINDQARRIERILAETSLTSAWWHGELSPSRRKQILREPPHALLTTPETLDVILSSDAYGHGGLLGNVRFVLIDEVHAFAESDRGAQLMSVLARLEAASTRPFVRVALSATVANPASIASWFASSRDDAPTIISIVAEGTKTRRIGVGLSPNVADEGLTKPEAARRTIKRLGAVLKQNVEGERSLIFSNSRALAERVTGELVDLGVDVHIHHGSVDQTIRRRTEAVFKMDGPKTIVATSTLELGIDIGDLDKTIQLGAPATASSFLQRLGRSGRSADRDSVGLIYALSDEELPMVLAVADLARQGKAELLTPDRGALHVLFHQVIEFAREIDGPTPDRTFEVMTGCGAFSAVSRAEFDDLLLDLFDDGFLELEQGRLYVGPNTEQRFGNLGYRDFYSVFSTDPIWTVKHGSETIGTLDLAYQVAENRETLFVLAGRKWRVDAIDRQRSILLVVAAPEAKIPRWIGDPVPYSFEVMRRTCELLTTTTSPLEREAITHKMEPMRADALAMGLDPETIIVSVTLSGAVMYTYAGFEANRYIAAMLHAVLDIPASATGIGVVLKHPANGRFDLNDVIDATRDFFTDDRHRFTLDKPACEHTEATRIGKYWPHLGIRTRNHLARHRLERDRAHFLRLPLMHVRPSCTLNIAHSAV